MHLVEAGVEVPPHQVEAGVEVLPHEICQAHLRLASAVSICTTTDSERVVRGEQRGQEGTDLFLFFRLLIVRGSELIYKVFQPSNRAFGGI